MKTKYEITKELHEELDRIRTEFNVKIEELGDGWVLSPYNTEVTMGWVLDGYIAMFESQSIQKALFEIRELLGRDPEYKLQNKAQILDREWFGIKSDSLSAWATNEDKVLAEFLGVLKTITK